MIRMFSLCMYGTLKWSECVRVYVFNNLFFVQLHFFLLVLVSLYTFVCICQSIFMHVLFLDVWLLLCVCVCVCVLVQVCVCMQGCVLVFVCVCVCVSQVHGHSDLRALRSGLSCLEYSQADVYLQAHAPSHQVKRPLSLPHVQPSPPLFLTSSFYSLLFSSSCLCVSILFFSLYYTITLFPTCSL